jgi:hypothetical protein
MAIPVSTGSSHPSTVIFLTKLDLTCLKGIFRWVIKEGKVKKLLPEFANNSGLFCRIGHELTGKSMV